jgi:hypothetical protein
VPPPINPKSAMHRLDPATPAIKCRRGPSFRYSTRLASWEPAITPTASGKMLRPATSGLSPRPSWKYSDTV